MFDRAMNHESCETNNTGLCYSKPLLHNQAGTRRRYHILCGSQLSTPQCFRKVRRELPPVALNRSRRNIESIRSSDYLQRSDDGGLVVPTQPCMLGNLHSAVNISSHSTSSRKAHASQFAHGNYRVGASVAWNLDCCT